MNRAHAADAPGPNDARQPDAPAAHRGPADDARAAAQERLQALRAGETAGPLDLHGAFLVDADLAGLDLVGCNLTGANLSRADLTGTSLLGACLDGAVLFGANLTDAELAGADLRGANLEESRGERVGFGGARLRGARLHQATLTHSSFTGADLDGADLRGARLAHSRFHDAQLTHVDLSAADLREVDLGHANVAGSHLDEADLRGARLTGLTGYDHATWIGSDLRDINFTGAYLVRRFAMDQNYIAEFRRKSRTHEAIYHLWRMTSDCGRSLGLWSAWVVGLVVLFAWLYTFTTVSYGAYETWLSPLYYSVVTLTTLGYGDVLPASVGSQVVAMVEVFIGYMMLGGLLSIFSNKMARRAE